MAKKKNTKYNNYTKEQLIAKLQKLEKHRYGLVWEDKPEEVAKQCQAELPVLTEEKDKAFTKKPNDPTHYIIEGDNYHSLYTLNFTHKKKIDVIYIDPPYNTGKKDEWIYNDHWVDENDRWRHSKWLSFMNKRLRLAKQLLKDDGVIFISIDDNEVAQLRMLCNKIFGEKNYVGDFIRKTKSMTGDEGTGINIQHENLLAFAKNKNDLFLYGEEKSFSNYRNPDNDVNGDWVAGDPSAKSGGDSTYFEIKNPYSNQIDLPPKGRFWGFSQRSLKKYIQTGKIKFKKEVQKGKRGFIFKRYKNELKSSFNPVNTLFAMDNKFMNQVGTKELLRLFENNTFPNPKPIIFIESLVKFCKKKDAVILDFFAGSGTTGQAVLELNKEDGGNRQFILCTNNENQICEEVTYPRIQKVIDGYADVKGIPANVKYFKTEFVPAIKTDNDKRVLVAKSTELLCLAEDTFDLVKQNAKKKDFAIFQSASRQTAII